MVNRKALVTGASGGIGSAIVGAFVAAGYETYGTSTSDAGAEKITQLIEQGGGRGCGLHFDAAAADGADKLMSALKDKDCAPNAPNILVNNAGITQDNLLMRLSDDDWSRVLDINLGSVFRLSKACLRGMVKERWGRIINISSVVALSGNPGQSNYVASKAGMIGFTKSLAAEVAARGVTVNCVAPGFIETPMTEALSEEQRERVMERIPAGRFGTADEVAGVVAFLCSDAAAYMTGETINLSGGLYMR